MLKTENIINNNEHNQLRKNIILFQQNIDSINNLINNIQSDILNLQNEDIDINSDITSLQNTDVAINNSISAINIAINSINNSITNLNTSLDALEVQVNNIIMNGTVTFREVSFSGVQDGNNNTFITSSHVNDIVVILNGLELVKDTHYNHNPTTNTITIIDLNSIPLATDYLIIKGNY